MHCVCPDTATFPASAVAVLRTQGYLQASAADDDQPTCRAGLERLTRHTELAPTDVARAHEVIGWARSLNVRDPRGYRAQIAVCLAHEQLSASERSLAASAVRAFNHPLTDEIRWRNADSSQAGPEPMRGRSKVDVVITRGRSADAFGARP